jgi:hypothetical protein
MERWKISRDAVQKDWSQMVKEDTQSDKCLYRMPVWTIKVYCSDIFLPVTLSKSCPTIWDHWLDCCCCPWPRIFSFVLLES